MSSELTTNLYAAKAIGQACIAYEKEQGVDTASAKAFVAIVTIAIGAIMFCQLASRGRGR